MNDQAVKKFKYRAGYRGANRRALLLRASELGAGLENTGNDLLPDTYAISTGMV